MNPLWPPMVTKTQNSIYWDQPHMNHYDPIPYESNILVLQAWSWTQYPCDLDTKLTWTIMDHNHWPLTQCPFHLSTIPIWTNMDHDYGHNIPVMYLTYPYEPLLTLTIDTMSLSFRHHTYMNHLGPWPWTQYPSHLDTIPTWTIMDLDHGHNIPVIYAPYPHELLWTMTMDTMSLSSNHHTHMNHYGPWPWIQ